MAPSRGVLVFADISLSILLLCSAPVMTFSKSQAMQTPKCSNNPSNLSGDSSLGVGDLDAQLLCAGNDLDSLSWWNGVCDSDIGLVQANQLSIGTYSAANVLLCMRRRSTSRVLLTRKALCPDGVRWRVFLLEPKPIYVLHQQGSCTMIARLKSTLLETIPSMSTDSYLYIHAFILLSWSLSHQE